MLQNSFCILSSSVAVKTFLTLGDTLVGGIISFEVSLSAWNALSACCSSVSISDGRHWGSGEEDLLKRYWARTLSKTCFGSSSLGCGWSEIFAFIVAKVIASCSIWSVKTALIRASLSSFHELEVLGTTAPEADGLRLTETLFGLAVSQSEAVGWAR